MQEAPPRGRAAAGLMLGEGGKVKQKPGYLTGNMIPDAGLSIPLLGEPVAGGFVFSPMKIHYLKCGTDCPVGGALFDGFSKGVLGLIPCAAQLVETSDGLVLIDTGYGVEDVRHPHPRLSKVMRGLLNIQFRMEETAARQVEGLGYSRRDVRHIILTHLDFDHAGGLEDFPEARVHVMEAEREAAEHKRRGFIARRRYRPAQWNEVRDWRTYAGGGEPWFGLDSVRSLDGLPPEFLMIPLPGHTDGHAGIAVQTPSGWVLNAGDAYFYRRELDSDRRRCTPGLRLYQNMMEVDRELRFANQERLRDLKRQHGNEITIFCSHDQKELEALQGLATEPRGRRGSGVGLDPVAVG